MKSDRYVAITFCCILIAGCAHPSRTALHRPSTTITAQAALDAHDDLIIEMLAHFDFGGGMTLADMTDAEFDDMMQSDDRMPDALGNGTPPTRAEFLMRLARLRALQELSAPTAATRPDTAGR